VNLTKQVETAEGKMGEGETKKSINVNWKEEHGEVSGALRKHIHRPSKGLTSLSVIEIWSFITKDIYHTLNIISTTDVHIWKYR